MAKSQTRLDETIAAAAELAERTLGQMAGAIDSLKAQHPNPVAEVREAVTAGVEKLTTLAAEAQQTPTAKKTKAVIRRATKRAGRTAKTVVQRVKKAVQRSRGKVPASALPATSLRRPVKKSASAKRKASKPGRVAGTRAPQAANMKRRRAHTAAQTKRRQARRDRKR